MAPRLLRWTLLLSFVAAVPARADLVLTTGATAERIEGGVRLSVTLLGAERPANDVDLLFRIASESSAVGNPLEDLFEGLEPFVRVPWGEVELSGRNVGERVVLRATQLSPLVPGQSALVTQRERRAWVRYRVSGVVAAGARKVVTFDLPFELPDVGSTTAMVLGLRYDTLTVGDFDSLPSLGVVGLTVLLRSAAQKGSPEARRAQLARLRAQKGLAGALHDMLLNELLDVGQVHTFGGATVGWLIPSLAPERWIDLSIAAVTTSGGRTWSDRFTRAMADQREYDPLSWALALDHLVPRKGKGAQMIRLLALGVYSVKPPANAELVPRLAALSKKKGDTRKAISAYLEESGAAILNGVNSWPIALAKTTVKQLGEWHVSAAALALLVERDGRVQADLLSARIGRQVLVEALGGMVAERVPGALLERLAKGSPAMQTWVRDALAAGGPGTLAEVKRVLKATGYPAGKGATPEALALDPAMLGKLVDRLRGVLMTPQAARYEARAEALLMREGDCLAPLHRARQVIHSQIILSQPLHANCQALRALEFTSLGRHDEAEALIVTAVKAAPRERFVRRRYRTIMTGKARRMLDQGLIEEAEELCRTLDPKQQDAQVRSIRADLHVVRGQQHLHAGDRPAAHARFVEARRFDPGLPSIATLMGDHAKGRFRPIQLLVLFMGLLGFFAAAWRYRNVHLALQAFTMFGGGSRVAEFHGPGSRRLLVAEGGLVAMTGWTARLVSWGQVRAGATTGHAGGPPGVILWETNGSAFFLSARSFGQFPKAADLLRRSAQASDVFFSAGPTDDDFADAENSHMAIKLLEAEKRRTAVRTFGIVLGAAIWASLAFIDIGVGSSMPIRLVSGLAMGGGVTLVTFALTDKLLQPASV